jgi:hypothetical protein
MRLASCPSRSLNLVCKIPILLLGLSETNTIGYYLLHMALCEGRADAMVEACEQRGYDVQMAETVLRYTFGAQQAYCAVFWVAHERALGYPISPALHLIPDNRRLTLDQLLSEPVSDSVPIDAYRPYRQRNLS